MEFRINDITKTSSFAPNLTLYRVNDTIYDEINYTDNTFYIIRRCGTMPYTTNHSHTTYVTDKNIIVYPLQPSQIYEEYFSYDDIPHTTPELSVFSIIGGIAHTELFNIALTPQYREYMEIAHGNSITVNTVGMSLANDSYVYKIKNNAPHELLHGPFTTGHKSTPTVTVKGRSSQSGTPTLADPIPFKHVGEYDGVKYRISAGRAPKITDLNSTANKWYLAQYNTRNYYDMKAIKKMTPVHTDYIDDMMLQTGTEVAATVGGFPLTSYYTMYAKAYVWVEEACTIRIGYYQPYGVGMWINGRRIIYGTYWNSNNPYVIQFKKGRNLIELTMFRELSSGGSVCLKGDVNGVYTEGVGVSTWDRIKFVTYHNKWLKNVISKDNEDFHFYSTVPLRSFETAADTYSYALSGSTVTQNVKQTTINSLTGFQVEEAANTYSLPAPSDIVASTLTYDFDTVFEELDYITTNGSDYYNSLINCDTEDMEMGMEFEFTMNVPSGKALMGSCAANDSEWLLLYFTDQNKTATYAGTSGRMRYDAWALNTNYTVSLRANNGTWTQVINGAQSTGSYNGTIQNSTGNTILFASYPMTPTSRIPNGMRIKGAYIKKDNVLVQTLIPVKRRADNKYGLYDKARNIFMYGTGQTTDYSQGNIDVTSSHFTGVKYLKLGAEVMDSIAYYDGRLYMYTTASEADVRAAITSGIDIMYATTTPTTVSITNNAETLNNVYEHNEPVNVLPNANALTSWRKYTYTPSVSVTDNGDESFTITYPNPGGTSRRIYQEFSTTVGKTYTISIDAKGSIGCYLCNGGSDTIVGNVIAAVRNQTEYGTYTFTWTASRATYRFTVGPVYENSCTVRNISITQDGYVPAYTVTDGNGESNTVTIDYSLSYTYSSNIEPIEVEEGKNYTVTRPSAGDVWQLRYYDVEQNIIGYSSYLGTSDTTSTVTIPENVYYIDLMDGNNVTTTHSVQLYDTASAGTIITTLSYNDGTARTLTLPHALSPGDELVYDENYEEWLYYPCSLDTDFITYTSEDFAPLLLNSVSQVTVPSPASLTIAICKKVNRDLPRPSLVSLTDAQDTGIGFGQFSWNEVVGASEYRIYVGNELVGTVDNVIDAKTFSYNLTHEYEGELEIRAHSSVMQSDLSYAFPLLTVPNTPTVKILDTVFENNRYYVTVKFDVNSMLVDSYNASYSIDGAAAVVVNLDGNAERTAGQERTITFNTSNISTGIDINIEAINETGTNNYMPTAAYSVYPGFTKWTYKQVMRQVLLGWTDTVPNETSYLLKYSIDNGPWLVAETDPVPGTGTQKLEYLSLSDTASMRVCLTPVINGQRQIFTKPITVSKANDITLVPPANFAGVKIRNGLLQFSWDDNYNISDTYFELFYRYSDGTTRTITVPHASEGGSAYNYRINTDTYGFATAKIKMIWELGESNYSDELTIYDLPEAETPPDIYHQTRTNGGRTIKISWSTYQFVRDYTLLLSIGGVQTPITCYDPEYEFALPNGATTEISAAVRATNIGGEQTAYSDTLSFKVCNTNNREAQTIYVHAESPHNMYTTIVGNNLVTDYLLYTLSQNSYVSIYPYYEKSYKAFLEKWFKWEENYWGHNVGSSGPLATWISNKCENPYLLRQAIYQQVLQGMDLHYTIYARCESYYKFYSEFVKMIIACFGDSITAGHPNYWAETGTGDITSQYEYWLSRRLKDEYDVVNKGYGQEKTNDMLERFDRDIASLGAHYCIILGGTNDWYQDASTKDLQTGYTVMDGAIDNIKQIVNKCWDNNIYAIIGTLTPRSDITEDGKKLFDYFNDWVKDWTTEQSLLGKKCAYVDFFNAGKDLDPPIPLEDPDKPYHLNPVCDGDNVYDAAGNLIRSGLGVHPSIIGYKVMGYSIPLTLFASSSSGFKLYKDASCQTEEYLNTEEASNQFYEVQIKNARRGKEKEVLRYIKNIGNYPCLYYLYITNAHNMDYWFVDEDGKRKKYLVGTCSAGMVKPLNIILEPHFDDYESSFEIRVVARELTNKELALE